MTHIIGQHFSYVTVQWVAWGVWNKFWRPGWEGPTNPQEFLYSGSMILLRKISFREQLIKIEGLTPKIPVPKHEGNYSAVSVWGILRIQQLVPLGFPPLFSGSPGTLAPYPESSLVSDVLMWTLPVSPSALLFYVKPWMGIAGPSPKPSTPACWLHIRLCWTGSFMAWQFHSSFSIAPQVMGMGRGGSLEWLVSRTSSAHYPAGCLE